MKISTKQEKFYLYPEADGWIALWVEAGGTIEKEKCRAWFANEQTARAQIVAWVWGGKSPKQKHLDQEAQIWQDVADCHGGHPFGI